MVKPSKEHFSKESSKTYTTARDWWVSFVFVTKCYAFLVGGGGGVMVKAYSTADAN